MHRFAGGRKPHNSFRKVTDLYISPSECYANDLSESWFSGGNDVVVVRQSDGSLKSTPLQVRVGKLTNIWTKLRSRKGKKGRLVVNDARVWLNTVDFVLGGSGELLIEKKGSSPSCLLSNRDLQQMGLKEGRNKARLVFGALGHQQSFDIYLYDQNQKFVITDIDGTITKSDKNGAISKIFKFDYRHDGVVELFDAVSKNGYAVIYLTALSQGAADNIFPTRGYLFNQLQNLNGYSLPRSPLFMSPITWHKALFSPDKMSNKVFALDSLFDLFDLKSHVVAGAYGNKDTDTRAYLNSGISASKVFLVNKKSKMINVGNKENTSYMEHFRNVDKMYPKY